MNTTPQDVQGELVRRHRQAVLVVCGFLGLTLALLAVAFFGSKFIYRGGSPATVMGLWIAILVFGLGAFVLRRTRFNAMRLTDIASLRGSSGLLKTLQDTTIQIACIGGAVALMGFIIAMITGDWTDMLRAGGVAVIVLMYAYPFKGAWQKAVVQLAPEP